MFDPENQPLGGHQIEYSIISGCGSIRIIQGTTDNQGVSMAEYIAGHKMDALNTLIEKISNDHERIRIKIEGAEGPDPKMTKQLMDRAEERLKTSGYETFQTPFGYFLDLKVDAPGHPLARLFKEF
jgi:hypothetical protein